MIKHDGVWQQASWRDALNAAAGAIGLGVKSHGAAKTAFLLGPHTTLEEASLAKRLATHLGGATVTIACGRPTPRWIRAEASLARFQTCQYCGVDRFLVIGSSLQSEQPLLAQRIRQRVKKGAALSVVGSIDDDLLCPRRCKVIVRPSGLWETLCGVLSALAKRVGKETPISVSNISASEEAIAASLASGKRVAVLIGDMALSQADASHLESLAFAIANMCGGSYGQLALSGGAGAALCRQSLPHRRRCDCARSTRQ